MKTKYLNKYLSIYILKAILMIKFLCTVFITLLVATRATGAWDYAASVLTAVEVAWGVVIAFTIIIFKYLYILWI